MIKNRKLMMFAIPEAFGIVEICGVLRVRASGYVEQD
jgi:hypothetical protein